MNIYQAIWDEDMNGNGIRPILPNEKKDRSEGYVEVDFTKCHPKHRIFKEVHLPERKRNSFQMVEKLFDNYTLNQLNRERYTLNEHKEVEEFLRMAVQTPPIQLARKFIEENKNYLCNDEQWLSHLHALWFRPFNWETGRDLTGFEHVFIGEQKRKKLVGHHFWYKYWLEDSAELRSRDQIELIFIDPTTAPYVITSGYRLNAFDYEKKRFLELEKKRCAFFVGMSPEGLMALGTVRALDSQEVREPFILNDKNYKIELIMSPDGKSIRTFYPVSVSK